MKRFYIGGKQYIPEKSTLLCSCTDVLQKSTLYHTAKGALFIVTESDGIAVRVVNREEAFAFMDEHPEGIDTDAYDAVFGEPEQG